MRDTTTTMITWNGKIESIARSMQQQIYLRYKYFSFPSLTIVARHVQLLRWNRATIASQLYRLDQSALLSNDTRRRFPCSTSFHFEGRAPFLLARIASMVITRMLRRVISVQKPKNVRTISLSLSLDPLWRLREPAPAPASPSSVATVTLGPRSRPPSVDRSRCCSTRSV